MLGNLLDNTRRHPPAGGTVQLDCTATDSWVLFLVTDTGSGIAAEHLGHVFDRCYRADTGRDRARGGSGIGLSSPRR